MRLRSSLFPTSVLLPLAAALLLLTTVFARADVFVLTNGGRIVGELLNAQESPREKYVIRTEAGVEVTLERSQIKQVLHPRPEELEYEKILPRYPDTVEGQWALAEWCVKNGLRAQREKHLRRVIELDPNHVEARHALGYAQYDGKWKTRAEVMTERGHVLDGGRWRLPQEKKIEEEKKQIDLAEKGWMQKLKRMLVTSKSDKDACDAIAAINDPFAVKALGHAIADEPRDEVRIAMARTLGTIGTNEAMKVLAVSAMEDPVPEVRLTCLDQLKGHESVAAVDYLVGTFKDKKKKNDNELINRAAEGLKQMGNPSAIGPLIDVLITQHRRLIQPGNSGQIGATFDKRGGTGMTMGSKPVYEDYQVENRAVLDALVALSGGVNFGFNVQAWKNWYATQKRQQDTNIRRN